MSGKVRPMGHNSHLTIDANGCITLYGWYFAGRTESYQDAVKQIVSWALGQADVNQDPNPSTKRIDLESDWS